MKKSEQKEHIEYVWRNLLRVAKEVNQPHVWAFLHTWCRAKEGGRHKALGRRGDNSWCYDQIPESKHVYDPYGPDLSQMPHPDPDPDYQVAT